MSFINDKIKLSKFKKIILVFIALVPLSNSWGLEKDLASLSFTTHNLWILLATCLVFIMHLGFACLETGMTQSKNTVNILFKNSAIMAIGLLTYAFCGFNLMYPGADFAGSFFGFGGFGIDPGSGGLTSSYNPSYTYYTDFIFQAMFAATAATIVSGAVCERIKLSSFLIFSTLFVAFVYPVIGMWKWGGGFLETLKVPFYDFAGSSIVHSVGGWAALAGALCLGPRLGRYEGGKSFVPHNYPLATVGVFLLWFGWFGFNGGSVLSASPDKLSLVFMTTAIAGASGLLASMIVSWSISKKPDLGMTLNGALAGLVGITAGADQMNFVEALIIGFIAGVFVVFSIKLFNKLRINDPVGAISVHLVCGIWGTLAVGLFGTLASSGQLLSQVKGIFVIALVTFGVSWALFKLIDLFVGLRVSKKEEEHGLDLGEHYESAYCFAPESIAAPLDVRVSENSSSDKGNSRFKHGSKKGFE